MQYVDPNIEANVKFFVNPKNWAESKIGVDWKALGKRHDRDFSSDDDEWKAKGESIYSSSTTLSIKELVESSPRYYQPFYCTIIYFIIVKGSILECICLIFGKFFSERQPTISMELSMKGNYSINNKPSSLQQYEDICIIKGMINLTGKGERLGVAKFNCSWGWNSAMGRIQARRVDTVSYISIPIF